MNEVILNFNYDANKIIKMNDIDYVPKDLLDEVIRDRRKLAMDYVKLTKEIADLKKAMRVAKNDINDRKRVETNKLEPLEEKVYSGWAFTERKEEKRDINRKIYERLCKENRVTKLSENIVDPSYDLVLTVAYDMYSTEYVVNRNRNKLSADEIALIVDEGNLCFGYSGDERKGKVFID